MVKKNRFYAMKLCHLVKKIMNGSTAVVVKDIMGNMVEALFNFMLIRVDECEEILKYLKAFEYKSKVLNGIGFS